MLEVFRLVVWIGVLTGSVIKLKKCSKNRAKEITVTRVARVGGGGLADVSR